MTKANGRPARGTVGYYAKFVDDFAAWIMENAELMDAIVLLREVGEETADAVDALCGLARVRKARFSLELWEAIVEDEGGDPEELLAERIPFEVMCSLRRAIYGSPWPDGEDIPDLRLV